MYVARALAAVLSILNGHVIPLSKMTIDWLQSQDYVLTDGQSVSLSVYLGVKSSSGAQDQIFVTVRQLRVC
jgi:hypothetical protein